MGRCGDSDDTVQSTVCKYEMSWSSVDGLYSAGSLYTFHSGVCLQPNLVLEHRTRGRCSDIAYDSLRATRTTANSFDL